MTTHSTHLAEAQLMASRDIPNVGSALRLTYGQIASLFQQYREELTRRLVGMVKSHETAADLVQVLLSGNCRTDGYFGERGGEVTDASAGSNL